MNLLNKVILTIIFKIVLMGNAYSLTIEESMVLAYKNNLTIKSQRESLKIANESKPQALSGFLPSVSINVTRGKEDQSFGAISSGNQNTSSESININQPLFRGFKTTNQLKKSDYQIQSARNKLSSIEQDILLNTIASHMEIVKDKEVVKLNENNVIVLRENLESTNQRFNLGEITATDVAQSEASLSDAISNKIIADGNLSASLSTYEKLTGFKANLSKFDIPKTPPEINDNLEILIDDVIKNNPIVQMMKNNVLSSKKDVNIEKSNLLPKIDLQASKQRQEGALFAGGSNIETETIQVVLSVPLFQSGSEYSKIRQAKYTAIQNEIIFKEQKQILKDELIKALRDYKVAKSTINSNKKLISSFRKSLEGVQQEAKEGARTTLDVLEAEQDLFNAKTNLILSKKDKIVSSYYILALKGQLNVKSLNLNVKPYDVMEHYNKVKYKIIGY